MSTPRITPAETALQAAAAALARQDLAAAVASYEQATALGAPARLTCRPHALALSGLGRHADAVTVFRPWFAKNQKDGDVLNVMGVLLKRAGRLEKAAEVLELARKRAPRDISPCQNLGNVYEQMGQPAKAAEAFRAGLRLEPGNAELWRLLARMLAAQARDNEALEALRRAFALAPGNLEIATMLVNQLQQAGYGDEARDLAARLRTAGGGTDTVVIEARLKARAGDAEGACAMLQEAIARDPGHLGANLLLAHVLGDGDRAGANAALQRAVDANPDEWAPLDRLIDSLARSRYGSETDHLEAGYRAAIRFMDRFPARIPEAARALRTVLMRVMDEDRMAATGGLDTLLPRWQADGIHSAVHYELGQVTSLDDRLRLVDWHREWGRKASERIHPVARAATGGTPGPLDAAFGPTIAAPARVGGRKLRIGFMSSDLRHHPVTYFTLPLLEGYDRDRVEVYCYSFYEGQPDQVQSLIARNVTAFRHWPRQPDQQVAEGIAADDLDMLFELGGSTAMNKLMVMAYRPARIGASWLGYPHSAGLEQIDMILTDPFIRPEDPRLLMERPFEMPQTWVAMSRMFGPHEIADGTPEARKGHLTFGTANNPYKYTPACLDAWAAVLRAVPGSRFVFLRPEGASESFIANTRTAFARRDVDPARLAFIGVRGDHMRHYNEIDIALDSLPHVGGTTTCESLWMGVPTISLVGPGFPERLSYSNLSNAGLGDLAVFSVDDYIARAAELAADPGRRLALRHGLRAQVRSHPLGQPERFTAAFFDLAARVSAE